MRVEWTRRALRALNGIAEYIARDRPGAAARMVFHLRDAVEVLQDHPELGREGRVPGTRELVVSGTPFIVPYRIQHDSVQILTVLHAARRWPEDF